nr:MAG TPA: Recombination and DNA repair protein domain, DNA repair, Cell [Crassvirales sp.]
MSKYPNIEVTLTFTNRLLFTYCSSNLFCNPSRAAI